MKHNSQHRNISIRLASLALASICLFTACGPRGYEAPISKFHAASAIVIESARVYFSELNKVERDSYILTQASGRAQIQLNRIRQVQVFSQEGLQARFEALDVLENYGDLLLKLATSNSPEKIRTETTGLGDALSKLSGTVSGLTHTDDQGFRTKVGPVLSLVGEVLDLVVRHKIQQALDRAIQGGDQPVNDLLRVLRSDIDLAYERKRTAFSDMRVRLVDEYNLEARKEHGADPEKLRIYAERIRAHEDRWEAFQSSNPGSGLDAMARAHSALVKYANSSKKISSFGELVEAMDDFAARAKRVGEAVQALRT